MMKTNIINWFKLKNWLDLTFEYRLVDVSVEGADQNAKELNRAFFNAINFLTYETKGVVSPAFHDGKRFIAVKADARLERRVIPGTPLDIILTPVDGTFTLDPKTMEDENLDLALRFLESSIDYQLSSNTNLWNGGKNTFLNKIPLRQSEEINTDIYYGFKFKVIAEDRQNVFICIDLAYKYVDKQNLHDVLSMLPQERYNDVVKGKNYLYQNGDDWYTVKGHSIGGVISRQSIEVESFKGTVFDFILNRGRYAASQRKVQLLQESYTFLHSYSNGNAKIVAGAACLAKAIHFADNGLHKLSINEPNKRFLRAELHSKKYFQNLMFNGAKLLVAVKPHLKLCDTFALPSLKYNNDKILDPYSGEAKYGLPLQQFPKRRREFIFKNGILNDSPFLPQYLFVPDDLPYSFGRSVKFYFDRALKQIAPESEGLTIYQYSMKSSPFASKVCKDLQALVSSKELGGGNAIFILPEKGDHGRFNKFLHDLVKKELFTQVKIKCVSAKSLKRYLKPTIDKHGENIYHVPDDLMPAFKSYQTNTIFELLIINRKWPYALAERLHHDLYIGIDAHEFFAGFVFFFRNGEKIVFDVEKVAKSTGSFRNEKINFKVIQEKIVEVLSRHLKAGEEVPKSIIILRDGVSFGEEEKAVEAAIDVLDQKSLLDKRLIKTGVIDVAKSSAIPVRAARYSGENKTLENPDCGTYFYMNRRNAFIFNTGFPYKVPGSSNPIQVTWSSGNIEFDKVLEDVFRLTQLTFSSPDRPTSLPLPLKLIDTLIRDVAHENDYANTQERELKIIEQSLN